MSKSASISASADLTELEAEADGAAERAEGMAEAVERARVRLERVQEISAVGMALLRDLGERAAAAKASPADEKSDDEAAAPADTAGDFAKISRALRLTLDLEARFDEALRALQSGAVVALKERRESRARSDVEAEEKRRQARRKKVVDQVSIAIARESESEAGDEERYDAMQERLEEDEAYIELLDRPLREVVGQMCADIGLTVDWTGWCANGWPDPPVSGPGARDRWALFRTASPRPMLPPLGTYAETGSGLARPPP